MNETSSISLKNLRQLLKPYCARNDKRALTIIAIDYFLFWIGQYLIIALPIYLKIIGSLFTGFIIFRLFILAHDASHGSFTRSKRLNYWLAQIAFLPGLTTFQGWSKSHNLIHHGFTNLVPNDGLWRPIGLDEYQNMNAVNKCLHKIYRTPFGVLLYYFIEIWAKLLYLPISKGAGSYKNKRFILEFLFITLCFSTWLYSLRLIANETEQDFLILLIFSVLIPFIIFNGLISFVTYFHHTNPHIRWYKNQLEWMNSMPHVTATVHLRVPDIFNKASHHFMNHHAHHLAPAIPSYNLEEAQHKLEEVLPGQILIQDFSWKWYLECTRVCKLYDFEKHEWVGFPE